MRDREEILTKLDPIAWPHGVQSTVGRESRNRVSFTGSQFIVRGSSDPRDENKALSATRARQLMGLPSGDTVFDYRDRAIIKFFLYSGARIGTARRATSTGGLGCTLRRPRRSRRTLPRRSSRRSRSFVLGSTRAAKS